jgi:predicted nucleic acid-binding protein
MAELIAFDSCVFIYVLDNNPDFFEKARVALRRIANEPAVVSSLVYTETLAKLEGKVFAESQKLLDTLCEYMSVQPFDTKTALLAARLRSAHRLRTADAIHIATAINYGATIFITNDVLLSKQKIPGIKIQII